MAELSKDTIYIDVDDEITTVIDKVLASDKKLVALVLPKRASVFQSIVNMKLLKLKTDAASKKLVLITTESSLLPLAGSVGIHVAKTLASRPEIPVAPIINESVVEANEDDSINLDNGTDPDVDLKALAAAPIGELEAGIPISRGDNDEVETIALDNEDEAADNASNEKPIDKTKLKKSKKDKNLKVPNFERFRKWLILLVLLIIILVVGGYLAVHSLPKATIDVQTDAATVNTSVNMTLSTSATSLDQVNNTIPAKQVSLSKTYTATVNATGQQNNGQEASGNVTMTATVCPSDSNYPFAADVPAGTGVVQNNLTYVSQSDTTFPVNGSGNKSTKCITYTQSGTTNIVAQNPGSAYNTSGSSTTFSVSDQPDSVTASGSASGGTDDIIQTVSQQDISNAENKITTDTSGAKQSLISQLDQANYYPIQETFTSGTPTITPNASAGTAAASVTVTETVVYTMYGVHSSDLQTLIDSDITSQVSSNQNILNDGLSNASFSANGSSPTSLTAQTAATVGPNLNVSTIKQQIEGKQSADIQQIISQNPHVTNVTVKLSPFYVTTAPNDPSKITVNIAKPTNASN